MTALTGELSGALDQLLGLYGGGSPEPAHTPTALRPVAAEAGTRSGAAPAAYQDAEGKRAAVIESLVGKDTTVGKAVQDSVDTTIAGRNRLKDHIANFHAQVKAITSLGDLRFGGPALLDAAQSALSSATKQVDSDTGAARQQAARIVPPAQRARGGSRQRSARRTRQGYRSSRARFRRHAAIRSDGTKGSNAVSIASQWLGTPYIWGGGNANGPTGGGFDCSGLTQYAVAQASGGEVQLPRTTYEQIYSGVRVAPGDVRPGDLVFPAESFSHRGPEHVQLAAGNGLVIEAPHSNASVRWSQMPDRAVVVRVL
ncbi:hypothetical protein NN3_23230 [Nocardia neocaledoniensis NBRC 108232]|uniref:NlpC/P60 family protein n=1 Tax=Nocardia neocaledoniensis TaxID=236511 RepID=A0A317N0S4_9NOCA|nr:C40 family peptidase [Nocardia neocaledoniensis]PWV66947.1 NlpC/P60 family protein [Nocardia neocaledoniensis]GEM31316.1 hypothetical protein NN3_23230 [Nocardia neocaledoniensis NBRC 108232]